MTNFEKWRIYTSDLTSPDLYIDWGFYYMICAALQRRVWMGPPHMPLFPNIYAILVGDPGVGKGLVIKLVANILNHHKLPDPALTKKLELATTEDEKLMVQEMLRQDYERAQQEESRFEQGKKKKDKVFEPPLLIPVAADASTYEALIKAMASAIRRKGVKEFEKSLQREVIKPYTHSSLCFCLEEIASLFRKRTEDLVNFLIQAYDCGDYKYDTKTQGKDRIKKCCLNFFGGTTPAFMQETFDDKLLTEGFSSRTFFIFASQNRKTSAWIRDLSEEQQQCYEDILHHIEQLSHLYGRVEVSKEDMDWFEEWWQGVQNKRPNISIKLNPYYSRKNIHIKKLAMAHHFSNSLDMTIKRESFEYAIDFVAKAERPMHYALGLDANNPLANPARKLIKFVEINGQQSRKELYSEFWEQLPNPNENLEEILEFLMAQGKIRMFLGEHPKTKATLNYYDVMRKEQV